MRGSRQWVWLGVGLVSLLSGALAQHPADHWIARLPEGQGKALVVDACVQCHTLESTVVQRKDRAGWKKTVNDMILRGALLTPTEVENIVEYLSTAFGPARPQNPRAMARVDLNTASLEEFLRATPLERAEAEAILEHRRRHGRFRAVEDVKKVSALKPERFEKIKAYLSVSSANPVSGPKPN